MQPLLKDIIKSGIHYVSEPYVLKSHDVLKAEKGSRLVGGVKLTKFKKKEGIYVCDLTEEGIKLSEMNSRGFGRKSTPSHNELFINSKPMQISQYPKKGQFLNIKECGEYEYNEWNEACGKLSGGFYYDSDQPKKWGDNEYIWTHGYWAWDWANTYERIAEFDKEKMFIKNHPPYGVYQYKKNQRFYFLNIPEEVTEPGDYCLDYKNNLIYFKPYDENDMDEVILSITDKPVFIINDVSGVTIEGFTIEAVRGHAISVTQSKDIVIKNCEIHNIGNTAITISDSNGVTVDNMYIHDTSDGGVNIHCGDRATLAPGNVIVTGCHFHDIAKWSRCYQPAVYMYGVGNKVIGNVIHDCPHTAILFGGNDMIITDNEIYRVVMETGDAGAIYLGRDYTSRGNVVSRNYIHHLGGVGMGTMGIYNDDCVSGTLMENNMFYKVNRAIFMGGGRDFVARGNVFIDCTPSIEIDGRGTSEHNVWSNMINDFMRKNFYNIKDGVSAIDPPYIDAYPELIDIHEFYQSSDKARIPPKALMEKNIICSERKIEYTWSIVMDELVEKDNIYIERDQLKDYLTPEQFKKFNETKDM